MCIDKHYEIAYIIACSPVNVIISAICKIYDWEDNKLCVRKWIYFEMPLNRIRLSIEVCLCIQLQINILVGFSLSTTYLSYGWEVGNFYHLKRPPCRFSIVYALRRSYHDPLIEVKVNCIIPARVSTAVANDWKVLGNESAPQLAISPVDTCASYI